MTKRFDFMSDVFFCISVIVREVINQFNILIYCAMKTLFDICFGVFKFTFKAIFWVVGLIIMLLVGSCPD